MINKNRSNARHKLECFIMSLSTKYLSLLLTLQLSYLLLLSFNVLCLSWLKGSLDTSIVARGHPIYGRWLKPGFHSNAIACVACVNENHKKRKRLCWQATKHSCWLVLTQVLAFLAVFVYTTQAMQAIVFEWKPGFSHQLGGRLPLLSVRSAVTFWIVEHHRNSANTKLYCLATEAHVY